MPASSTARKEHPPMRHHLAPPALFALLCLACSGAKPPGGGETRESLHDKDLGVLEEVVAILESVKDEATLNAARPRLNGLVKRHKEIRQQADNLPWHTQKQQAAMQQRFGARQQALKAKLTAEMRRVRFLGVPGDVATYGQMEEFGRDF
jgi:hypothetical protein